MDGEAALSAGRMPAINRSRDRIHASGAFVRVVSSTPRIDHITSEISVLVRSDRTRPCAWRVGKEPCNQVPRRLDEMVAVFQSGEAAQMLRLVRARRLQEVLEPRAVRPLRRLACHGDRCLQDLGDQRLDEGILRGETVDRDVPIPTPATRATSATLASSPFSSKTCPAAASRRSRFFNASLANRSVGGPGGRHAGSG